MSGQGPRRMTEEELSERLRELRRRVRDVEKNGGDKPFARNPARQPGPQSLREIAGLQPQEPPPEERYDGEPLYDYKTEHYAAQQVLEGDVLENPFGSYFLHEKLFPADSRHGSLDISALGDMPGTLLEGISRAGIPAHDPARWAFLDTETTGLAGGTGTCAFLIGVGTIEPDGFRVRLFFMRDYDEEPAMLTALAEFLAGYDVLVTYNGKSYDAPLIDTRYRIKRLPNPLERMHHLDLLHGARQLWKLRMQSCKLTRLEAEVLGVERHGDLPGELIPYYYFEYLKTKQAFRLVPLFHHNVMDIVSLACLTAVVLPAFGDPEKAPLRHGADMLGLARWLNRSKEHAPALRLYRRAIDAGLGDEVLFDALWEAALAEKRLGMRERMAESLTDLAGSPNPRQAQACEELAKHLEHHARAFASAEDFARRALALDPTPERAHRVDRVASRRAKAEAKGAGLF